MVPDRPGQRADGRLDEPGTHAYETSYSISTGYTTDRTIVLP
ncbi:MAG TPA: hypothetical protein VK929_13805 [Longimicrobiales bacterium]|nr:hypothetical protein [Longimicrobiales bacterium]